MKHSTLIFIMMTTLLTVSGCGLKSKAGKTSSATDQDTVSIMADTMALSVPDASYSINVSPYALNEQSNVRDLMLEIDSIAAPLKELNSKFKQVLTEGTRTNGSLNITDNALSAVLSGLRDDSKGIITWTYTRHGVSYFAGTTSTLGTSGDLTFSTNGFVASPVNLRWSFSSGSGGSLVKTVSVRQTSASYLDFTLTYAGGTTTPAIVEVSGKSANNAITGRWTADGGKFTLGAAAPLCWNSHLENSACP